MYDWIGDGIRKSWLLLALKTKKCLVDEVHGHRSQGKTFQNVEVHTGSNSMEQKSYNDIKEECEIPDVVKWTNMWIKLTGRTNKFHHDMKRV